MHGSLVVFGWFFVWNSAGMSQDTWGTQKKDLVKLHHRDTVFIAVKTEHWNLENSEL